MDNADKLLWAGQDAWRGRNEEERQAAFEERIVLAILRRAGNTTAKTELRREAKEKYGYEELHFRWFQSEYPQFPYVLGAAKLPYTAGITLLEAIKGSFSKLPFFREYRNFLSRSGVDPDESTIAFFFTLGSSVFVLRNFVPTWETENDPDVSAARHGRLVRPFGNPPTYYVIEDASAFLERLPTDWV